MQMMVSRHYLYLREKDVYKRQIVVDPMGEYSPLIKRLGGQVIEIAPDSPHHINPMDIDLSFDEENPMACLLYTSRKRTGYDAACYYDGKLLGRCTKADSDAYTCLLYTSRCV